MNLCGQSEQERRQLQNRLSKSIDLSVNNWRGSVRKEFQSPFESNMVEVSPLKMLRG